MRETPRRPYQNRKDTSTVDTLYLTVSHLPLKDIIRIFAKITIDPQVCWRGTPCWTWYRPSIPNGKYGVVSWHRRPESIHRLMYAWAIGPVPRKKQHDTPLLQVDHQCHNTLCCNPVHLQLVTPQINTRQALRHHKNKTHCENGHLFTPENTYFYGPNKAHRQCKRCNRERAAARESRLRTNADYREHKAAVSREYRLKPETKQRKRELEQIKRQDPLYRAQHNQYKREWRHLKEQDPSYRSKNNARKREWRRKRKSATQPVPLP